MGRRKDQVLAVGNKGENTSKVEGEFLLEVIFNRHFYQ